MPESTEPTSPTLWDRCADTTPRDWRNTRLFLWMVAAWGVVFVGVTWLLKRELLPPGPVSWVAAVLPTAAGLLVCLAYARYLRQADELQRLTQLWALGLGFAAGWLALSGYPLLERLGAPPMHASGYSILMAVVLSLGVVIGQRRYR